MEKSKHHDQYLLALYIAQEKMGIKSLTPSEINIFLTEPPIKLPKLYTTNISRDLSKKLRQFATPYKAESGFGYEYRLTSFGEQRVKNLIDKIKKEESKEG